nr:hypothetical protein [Lachnospiraceae bacterium]
MKRDVWVLCNSREDMVEAQRRVNAGGALRAICLFSFEALTKAMERAQQTSEMPSLLIADYESACKEEFRSVKFLMSKTAFIGIPLFFMTGIRTEETDRKCYEMGATVILTKPFSKIGVTRIERAAMQQMMTRNYEKVLQRQTMELTAAKEIKRLNEQLSVRNRLLHQILGKYFSDEVVDVILEKPEGVAIGGEKRVVTVMMADLRGFTALSERLSADEVVSILNHYLSEMTEVIMKYKGTIIEFIGDAILAVFGAPLAAEHTAEDAVAAAIEMQNRMSDINRYNRENGYPDIEAGIGIHMGEAFIGNIGSEQFMRYNVIGQVVNLCSRIQSYSVGGQILVSQQVMDCLADCLGVKNSFEISMKGIHEKLSVFEAESLSGLYERKLTQGKEDVPAGLKQPVLARIFLLQGKSVVKDEISATISALSEHKIVLMCDKEHMNEFSVYQDVDIVVGEENAYAKIIKKEKDRLQLHFTFLSEFFLEVCGYEAEERK